ncbi:EscU/YscU/HrcU family type III secretion system export apparatus switch protein [Sulfurimonas sp.]|uniref:EscU/YscU/HrcU family type III secretion system export apparatus switch protein n=1 Tax=Sulfurimonas sp. TaxID=2022749 RepID=UPI0025E38A02|nr:EscU/YscU/HrcU family type III secretion system export apparatus switch protein [Sulfurimonas sp.]MDD5157998.1 EscU/YscU/HrcU family type III secretion system export apparatus switch protein [Sulfurimonas sp.]
MQNKAAALKYDKANQGAPKVIASGKGAIAKKIIEKAKEFNVPIFANEALVNSLVDLDIDHEIPAELYKAVVEVFVWLMKNEKKYNNEA